jgi:hypothetical protein
MARKPAGKTVTKQPQKSIENVGALVHDATHISIPTAAIPPSDPTPRCRRSGSVAARRWSQRAAAPCAPMRP